MARVLVAAVVSGMVVSAIAGAALAGGQPTGEVREHDDKRGSQITWADGQIISVTDYGGAAPLVGADPDRPQSESISFCNTDWSGPNRSGSTIWTVSTVVCSQDVYYIAGTQQQWRGLSNPQANGAPDVNFADFWAISFSTNGPCASLTWAYFTTLSLYACSWINGCVSDYLNTNYRYFTC